MKARITGAASRWRLPSRARLPCGRCLTHAFERLVPGPQTRTHCGTIPEATFVLVVLSSPCLTCRSRRGGPAADIKVTTSDLRGQVGRIQNQVKEIQEVVRMYSSTTGPRRVRRTKVDVMSQEAQDTNVCSLLVPSRSAGYGTPAWT